MRALRKVIRQLILEKFELDKPLDTSLEDWKGYFEKADDLDKSIKDDFLTAREMADEALELLDDERDNIVAAMEELEAERKKKAQELEEAKKKDEEQNKKKKDILKRLEARGAISTEEYEAGLKDYNNFTQAVQERYTDVNQYFMEAFQWGLKNNRMDVCNQSMYYTNKVLEVRKLAEKFAYPNGKNTDIKSRGFWCPIQELRACSALYTWLEKKARSDFFWQGNFPDTEQLVDKMPPPANLGELLDK